MPNENEKSNHQTNYERLVDFLDSNDFYFKDGSSLDDWKNHPEYFTEDYDPDDYDDPDYGDVEDDLEVNKDSRFLK